MYIRYLFKFLQSRLLAVLILAIGLQTGCNKETQSWENDGQTATITLHVPMAESSVTRTTDEEYRQTETEINTLRILIMSKDYQPIINKKFESSELADGNLTFEDVPIGTVIICAIANEAALGKNYDDYEDFRTDLADVGDKKNLLIIDEQRTYFPKWFTEPEIAQYGLPMSWFDREAEINRPGSTPQTIEVNLERTVAKLNIIMNNARNEDITITAMTFGQFFGDRIYLFREADRDIPDGATYAAEEYSDVSLEIPGRESATFTCYIYPSYAWEDSTPSPYTIGFTTSTTVFTPKAFIDGNNGAKNSIDRNTQVNIYASFSERTNIQLEFEVKDWNSYEIDVPPFN